MQQTPRTTKDGDRGPWFRSAVVSDWARACDDWMSGVDSHVALMWALGIVVVLVVVASAASCDDGHHASRYRGGGSLGDLVSRAHVLRDACDRFIAQSS